jgi:predicted nucleotidyltransferase component of viral defense system
MTVAERARPRLHNDLAFFQEAVTFTAAATGFATQIVEKDYFCTLLLGHLAAHAPGLVFKGGTCLAKVHSAFYRLSEDLDFLIPMPVKASRAERRRAALTAKSAFDLIDEQIHGLRVLEGLAGANQSRQYVGVIAYQSRLGAHEETIKVEIGLREPLLTPAIQGHATTLLMDPLGGGTLVAAIALQCLSWEESMAEKLRAALSRREPAIRDFYDNDHAVRRRGLRLLDRELLELVRRKVAVPGNRPVPVSAERLAELRSQVTSRLRPILRDRDLADFDLDVLERVFAEVAGVAAALA